MLHPIILLCALGGQPCEPAEFVNPVFRIERQARFPGECWAMAALVLAQNSDMLGGRPYRVRCERVAPLQ